MSMSPVFRPLSPLPRRQAVVTALLVCLLVAGDHGLRAADPTPPEAKPPQAEAATTEDGFTRESLSEINAPESIPPTDPPEPAPYRPHRPKTAVHRVRHFRHAAPAHRQTRLAAAAKPPHRNPAESFVYAWNGWVIRTFHTKTGTVLLQRIGAKA